MLGEGALAGLTGFTPAPLYRGYLQLLLRIGPEPAEFVNEVRRLHLQLAAMKWLLKMLSPRAPRADNLEENPQIASHTTTLGV